MSIGLKQAAEQVLKELGEARKIIRASSSRQLAKDWDRRATDALANLRTAIQQPATPEPVGQVSDLFPSVRNKLHAKGFDSDAPLYTHPAPGVPDDVVKDAERYRWLRENGTLGFSGAPSWRASVSFDAVDAYAQTLDSNIDAAIAAALGVEGWA